MFYPVNLSIGVVLSRVLAVKNDGVEKRESIKSSLSLSLNYERIAYIFLYNIYLNERTNHLCPGVCSLFVVNLKKVDNRETDLVNFLPNLPNFLSINYCLLALIIPKISFLVV